MRAVMLVVLGAIVGGDARADVVDSQPNGFTVSHKVSIAAPPAKVWAALGHVGAWWDGEHSFSGDSRNLSLDLKPGGMFAETLSSGGAVRHMVVVYADPGKRLRMEGGLGPLQAYGVSGSLTFTLSAEGSGTVLVETYDVGGHAPGGLDKLAGVVDGVLTHQVDRLAAYAEGRPLPK